MASHESGFTPRAPTEPGAAAAPGVPATTGASAATTGTSATEPADAATRAEPVDSVSAAGATTSTAVEGLGTDESWRSPDRFASMERVGADAESPPGFLTRGAGAAAPEPPRRVRETGESPTAESTAAESPPTPRPERRPGALTFVVESPAEDTVPDPTEPEDPVVSASAIGIDTTAEPTPNATANAPTRPTYRE